MPELYGGQPEDFAVVSAATAPIAGPAQKSWLDYRHPMFEKMLGRWQLTQDFYLGEPADGGDCARKYLVKRFQGEPDLAFKERVQTSDFTPHLGTLLDTLAGQLFGVDDRTQRYWANEKGTDGLGDPNKPGTPANRLARDADGQGTNWRTLWREFTLDVLVFQRMWVLIDTVNGMPVVKLVKPLQVPNWVDGPLGPTSVLMCEQYDTRTSLEDDPQSAETYVRWDLGGWSRWRRSTEGYAELVDPGLPYSYVDRNGAPTLPIFPVELPMRRYVSWLLAKKSAVLFNQESVRDFAVRISNFTKLLVNVADPNQLGEIREMMRKGENVLPVDNQAKGMHTYISPPTEPSKNASEVLNKKIEDYWMSGFKQYADAAQQKTATEVKQDVASGVGAFLQLLAAAVENAENGAMYRLEQAEFGESPNRWNVAHVDWPDDFSTLDLALVLDQMKKRYLGDAGVIPVGRKALIQLAKEAAAQDGLPVDDAEIKAAVDAQLLSSLIGDLNLLNVTPPLVKSRLAMRLVAAMGVIDPNEVIAMSDGEMANLLQVMLTQAEDLANIQDKQARLAAEMPPFTGFGG